MGGMIWKLALFEILYCRQFRTDVLKRQFNCRKVKHTIKNEILEKVSPAYHLIVSKGMRIIHSIIHKALFLAKQKAFLKNWVC